MSYDRTTMDVVDVSYAELLHLAGQGINAVVVDHLCATADGIAVYTNLDNHCLDRGHRKFIPILFNQRPPSTTLDGEWTYTLTHTWRPNNG